MELFTSLSPLQRDFLAAFFKLTDRFFLTGGAALVGAYGLPRQTRDLDLFTLHPEGLRPAHEFASAAAASIGADLEILQTFTTFRRYLLRRDEEAIEVDFVHELAQQVSARKLHHGPYIFDPLEEIFANKICTLVGRSEVRDLWDVYHLIGRGYDLFQGIEHANIKDGGVDLESVLFVISSLNWEALKKAARRAGYGNWDQIEAFYASLKEQLAMRILPRGESQEK